MTTKTTSRIWQTLTFSRKKRDYRIVLCHTIKKSNIGVPVLFKSYNLQSRCEKLIKYSASLSFYIFPNSLINSMKHLCKILYVNIFILLASRSVAPTTIVTHVKATDKEYMNRTSAVRRTSPSAASNERVVSTDIIPPSPSMTISQASEPIRVTPSPLSWDNRENSDISLPDSLYGNTTKQK